MLVDRPEGLKLNVTDDVQGDSEDIDIGYFLHH